MDDLKPAHREGYLANEDAWIEAAIEYRISATTVLRGLIIVTLIVYSIGIFGHAMEHLLGIGKSTAFVRLFQGDLAGSLPHWFSSMLLVFGSVLLALVAHGTRIRGGRHVLQWKALSVLFFLLSLEHLPPARELAISFLNSLIPLPGTTPAGITLAAVLLIALVVVCAPLVRDLTSHARLWFALGGGMMVFAAVGMEAGIAGMFPDMPAPSLQGLVLSSLEELLEDIAVIVVAYALLLHLQSQLRVSGVRLGMH